MSDKIKYDNKLLALINQLANINQRLVIENTENPDEIEINNRSASHSVHFLLTAPKDKFNFDGDNIAFYDYSEFFKLFSVNDNPSINQNINNLVISKDRAKLKYFLAEKEAILIEEMPYVAFEESNASFSLSSETLKKLKTMCALTKATDLTFKVSKDQISITLFCEQDQPSYEEDFDLDTSSEEDFEITVDSDIIKFTPEHNYTIDLNSQGLIRFTYITKDNIKLELYVAESEERN